MTAARRGEECSRRETRLLERLRAALGAQERLSFLRRGRTARRDLPAGNALPFAEIWEPLWLLDYHPYFNVADRKGYSGTATFTRRCVRTRSSRWASIVEEHGREGRTITTEFDGFYLVNVYVPNARRELTRLDYRQQWDRDFLAYVRRLETRKPVVFCGDLNVAHRDDRPRAAQSEPRLRRLHGRRSAAGFDHYLAAGFLDSFREFEEGPRALHVVEQHARRSREEHRLAHRLFSGFRRRCAPACGRRSSGPVSAAATIVRWASSWTFERVPGEIGQGRRRSRVCHPEPRATRSKDLPARRLAQRRGQAPCAV